MLVLSRKNQESVIIGNADGVECLVRITVIEIRGSRVKLGFEAASGVPIHRSEIWKQTQDASQPTNGQPCRDEAANEAMGRWQDDGGTDRQSLLPSSPSETLWPLMINEKHPWLGIRTQSGNGS